MMNDLKKIAKNIVSLYYGKENLNMDKVMLLDHLPKYSDTEEDINNIQVGDMIYLKDVSQPVKVESFAKDHPFVYTNKGIFDVDKIDIERMQQ